MIIEDKLTQEQRIRAEALAFALEHNQGKSFGIKTILADAREIEAFITGK